MTDQTPQTPTTNRWQYALFAAGIVLAAALAAIAIAANSSASEPTPTDEPVAITSTTTTTTVAPDSDLDIEDDAPLGPTPSEEEADSPEVEEEPAPEPEPEPEPEPDPSPAELVVPESLDLEDDDTAILTIANDGDLPMDIFSISSDFAGFSVNGPGNLVEGGAHLDFGVSVDDSILPWGEYTVYVDVSTSAGDAVVELHGFKELQVLLLDYDVEVVTPALFVPHGYPWATIQIMNNEDFEVNLNIDEDHARLTSPDYITLDPGMNELKLPIAMWAVDPLTVMQMQVDLSWLIGQQTVTITKMGM